MQVAIVQVFENHALWQQTGLARSIRKHACRIVHIVIVQLELFVQLRIGRIHPDQVGQMSVLQTRVQADLVVELLFGKVSCCGLIGQIGLVVKVLVVIVIGIVAAGSRGDLVFVEGSIGTLLLLATELF